MTEHPIPEDLQAELLAARIMDWKQVALNHTYGRPCFHLEPEGRFCGRAEGWHDKTTDRLFHLFTPLESFIERIAKAEQERDHLLKVNAEQAARYWEITGNRNRFANKLLEALGRDPLNSEDVSILDEVERIKAEADALHDEIDALKEHLAALSKPVTDEEWASADFDSEDGEFYMQRYRIDALIAARTAPKGDGNGKDN